MPDAYSARRLKAPGQCNPNTPPIKTIPFANAPTFASAHEGTIAITIAALFVVANRRLVGMLLLGVGGVRALRVWSRLTGAPEPEVYHTNEGHAGFLGVERIRELVAQGLGVDDALEAVRAATVFTTHTPVPAGIDRFGRDLVSGYFGGDNQMDGIPVDRVLALGAEDYDGGDPTVFNMAVMGLRLGGRANGVSLLHGQVSREMFEGLWPGFDAREVPITSVTNGVHSPTWVAPRLARLGAERLGLDQLTAPEAAAGWLDPGKVSDADLWAARTEMRGELVDEVRRRVRKSWRERGASPAELGWVDKVFSPDVLTIGFARRVPTYKRLTLMLRDPERLKALLLDPERPIQLVGVALAVAGVAAIGAGDSLVPPAEATAP
jgi:glycogen phosphorylase